MCCVVAMVVGARAVGGGGGWCCSYTRLRLVFIEARRGVRDECGCLVHRVKWAEAMRYW